MRKSILKWVFVPSASAAACAYVYLLWVDRK